MPANRQVVDVPLALGLNQKADKRYVDIGGAYQLVNCRKQKNNAYIKRPGHSPLSKTVANGIAGSIASCVGGGSARGVPWISDGRAISTYSDAAAQWTSAALLPEAAVLDKQAVDSLAASTSDRDYAVANGLRLVIYTGLNGTNTLALYYAVLDATTGAAVVAARQVDVTLVANVLGAKLCQCGTTVVLTYVNSGILYARSFNLAAPFGGWTGVTIIANDGALSLTSLGQYAASPVVGDTTRFAIAYELAVAHSGNTAVIRTFATSGFALLTSTYNETTYSLLGPWALSSVSGGYHWVCYSTNTGGTVVRAWGYADPAGTPTTPATLYTWSGTAFGPHTICPHGNNAVCFWSQGPSSAVPAIGSMALTWGRAQEVTNTGGATAVVGAQRFTAGINWASAPVVLNGIAYLLAYLPSNLQPAYYLVACDWYGNTSVSGNFPVRVVASFAPRIGSNANNNGGLASLPHICNDSASLYSVPVEIATQPGQHALYVESFDFASSLRHIASGDLGENSNTAIVAAQSTAYDGEIAFELGYAYYPELAGQGGPPTGIVPSVSGGSMGTGTISAIPQKYQYAVQYQWWDAQGNVHRSAPSVAQTADLSGLANGTSGSVALALPCLGLTQRRLGPWPFNNPAFQQSAASDVYIIPYRTTAGGTIFYRLPAITASASTLAPFVNNDGALTIAYTDTLSDASLTDGTHPTIDTQGGFLPNMGPPSSRAFTTHAGRFWLAGSDDPAAIWPSKALTPGEVPGFNENQCMYASGPVRALASMDANLVVFVQRTDGYGVEFISGQGPLDNGLQSDWTPPQRIPSDTGAVDQRGVCAFPGGVLFRGTVGGPNGSGGIFVLARDFQVQYIGGAVEDTLATYPVVTSMRLHPNAGRIYVECVNSDTAPTAGARIVWDYIMQVWSIDQVYDADTAGVPGSRFAWVAQVGAAPTYHWATAGGRVYREKVGTGAGANFDGAQWVSMQWTTAQIDNAKSTAIRFWRVQLGADSVDPCNFTMTLTFDGAPSSYYSENLNGSNPSFTAGAIAAFDRYPQVDVEQYVGNQLAKSIAVSFADSPPTGASASSGAGMSCSTLSLEVGIDQGKRYPNIPAAQRG